MPECPARVCRHSGLPDLRACLESRSLFNQVQRMKLDVATLAPVHGRPVLCQGGKKRERI
jgi:hypothetical protein